MWCKPFKILNHMNTWRRGSICGILGISNDTEQIPDVSFGLSHFLSVTKVGLALIWPYGQPWQFQYNSRELFAEPSVILTRILSLVFLPFRFHGSFFLPGHSICPPCYLGILTLENSCPMQFPWIINQHHIFPRCDSRQGGRTPSLGLNTGNWITHYDSVNQMEKK